MQSVLRLMCGLLVVALAAQAALAEPPGGADGGVAGGDAGASGGPTAASPGGAQAGDAAAEAGPRREGNAWVLPTGVRYVELRAGRGATPRPGAKITIHYTGSFKKSGKVFDTSRGKKPWSFVWGKNQVIPGYEDGMATMRVGGRRKLWIPPERAYGEKGFKKIIPPNAELVFDVELLGVR